MQVKYTDLKFLIKVSKKKKTQEEHNFSKDCGLLPGPLYLSVNTRIVCL